MIRPRRGSELGWAGDSNWLSYLSRGLALAVIALSLVPLVGYGGQISLAVMTFAGGGRREGQKEFKLKEVEIAARQRERMRGS